MSHPDAAFSDTYVAPHGLDDEPCRHSVRRQRSGPTSKMSFMITVDSCGWCGRILRSVHDLTWQQYFWVRRWNAGIGSKQ